MLELYYCYMYKIMVFVFFFFFFKQKTAYEMRISDWSSDVCSSDLRQRAAFLGVLFLVGASNNIDRNILGVLLPQIKAEFVLSDTELGLLSGVVFAFFYATLGLPLARWADRGHRPRILTLSRSEEHTSELQSLMRTSYAVFCLKKKNIK